jgi:hypothetical protein
MRGEADPRIVIFTTLKSELEALELDKDNTFDSKQLAGLASAREKIFSAMFSLGFSRYDLGLAIRDYREIYKQGGEQQWRSQAGEKVAIALGYTSLKSVYNLIEDALLADELGPELRNAMVARGYDPAARKNKEIVKSLIVKRGLQPSDDASKLVNSEIAGHSKNKASQHAASTAELEEQLIARISKFIIRYRKPPWKEALDEIYKRVATMLKDERAKRASGISKNRSDLIPPLYSGTRTPSGPTLVQKSAGPRLPGDKSSRPPRKTTVKSWQFDKKLHPWGDARLSTLRLLNSGPAGTRWGEFHRKLLYDVQGNPKATRFLLAGTLDLFDPGIPNGVFDEHMDVFLQAQRHTFLALTPHAGSVRQHWERRKKMPGRPGFPDNLRTCVTVDCVDHLQRLNILPGMDMRTKCASFVDYRSDASRSLSNSTFSSDITGLELVVFGWDFADPKSPLSSEDACSLAEAVVHSNTTFFFTHPKSKQAFLMGNPPMSELPSAANPYLNDPNLTALLEEAQSRQRFPDGWLGHADWAGKQHLRTFMGEEVELFKLRSDSGESPAGIAEAS